MRRPDTSYRALLATYLRPQAGRVVVLTVLLFGGIGLQLVNPQLLRTFIDAVSAGDTGAHLTVIAGIFIGVALAQQAMTVAATHYSEHVGWTATNALRADLVAHCLGLDLSFHKARTPGELVERIDGDATALANFFSQFVVRIVGSLLLLFGILVMLWLLDWRVGLVLSLFGVVTLAAMTSIRFIAVPYWRTDRQASADLFGFIEERLAGLIDIRSSGAESYVMRRLYGYMRTRLRTGSKARLVSTITWCVPVIAFAIGHGAAFALAAYLFVSGGLSLGAAFLIYFYTQLMGYPLQLISHQIDDFQKANAGLLRIRELLETRDALVDGPGAAFPAGPLAVAFDRVSFGYDEAELVLHDLSFRVEPGQVMGLLGRTGSGKTSIARLLMRLYDPQTGAIRLGDVDLRAARRDELRRQVGLVTQDVQLFRASVRDNLTFFDPGIDDARIMAALADLGLQEWHDRLSAGLDTMLSAGGSGLSAGEAQLLAFTRVFLKNPGLVILDEASSRLDPATERLIDRAIDRLLRGRTGIIIAHRLATVQRADTILILDHGRVMEHGTRQALAGDANSRFAALLRTGMEEALA